MARIDWKNCLDRIEAKGYDDDDAYSEILEYIREVATVDEKREVLQNVEQRVKKIVNYDFAKAWFLRRMSESEHDVIELLMGVRYVVLNEMMLHPTPAEEEGYKAFRNELDDGDSWDECYLHKPEFADICVCYAMHALHTHQDYCLPDILRMDDFVVKVHLQYENEVCDTRDAEKRELDYEPSWFQKLIEEDVNEFGGKHTLNPIRKK